MSLLIAIDGPPGVGKTTRILELAGSGDLDAVITYGKDAAAVIHDRAPQVLAGTIYSLSWKAGASKTSRRGGPDKGSAAAHSERAIWGAGDLALPAYEKAAPSRRPPQPHIKRAVELLHRWDGCGDPPVDINDQQLNTNRHSKFIIGLARWLSGGAEWADGFEGFAAAALDEAQDFSRLELAASMRLLRPGGVMYAYGDPGQSIFSSSKGLRGAELPPAWSCAHEKQLLSGGHRCGQPLADMAAAALAPYWDRPGGSFAADHETEILTWNTTSRPQRGLVLGYSRTTVANAFREWGLRGTWIQASKGDPDKELVLSTIHGAKGAQADDVFLLPNKSLCQRARKRDLDALRVIYVALTRAKRRLYIPTSLKSALPR